MRLLSSSISEFLPPVQLATALLQDLLESGGGGDGTELSAHSKILSSSLASEEAIVDCRTTAGLQLGISSGERSSKAIGDGGHGGSGEEKSGAESSVLITSIAAPSGQAATTGSSSRNPAGAMGEGTPRSEVFTSPSLTMTPGTARAPRRGRLRAPPPGRRRCAERPGGGRVGIAELGSRPSVGLLTM